MYMTNAIKPPNLLVSRKGQECSSFSESIEKWKDMCSNSVIQTIRKDKNCVPLPSIRIENGVRTRPHRGRPYFCGECLYQSNHEVHQSYSLMSQFQEKERIQSYCLESNKVVLFFLLVDELNL